MASNFSDCVETVNHTQIKLEDSGSKRVLIVKNSKRELLSRVRMDGGVIKQQTCADWLVREGLHNTPNGVLMP
jgi:hypothetical protein